MLAENLSFSMSKRREFCRLLECRQCRPRGLNQVPPWCINSLIPRWAMLYFPSVPVRRSLVVPPASCLPQVLFQVRPWLSYGICAVVSDCKSGGEYAYHLFSCCGRTVPACCSRRANQGINRAGGNSSEMYGR